MKNTPILCLALLAYAGISFAQAPNPVKWNNKVEQHGTETTLVFNADIESGWHIYSQFTPDGGPLPTVFTFEENGCYQLVDKAAEPKAHEEFDSTFGVKVLTLDGKPAFTQKIKLKSTPCTIKGRVEGMVCKESCIMFDNDFSFTVAKQKEEGAKKN